MTLLLSFAGAFLGAVLIAREARRLEFRAVPVIGGFVLLVLGAFGCMALLFQWLAS